MQDAGSAIHYEKFEGQDCQSVKTKNHEKTSKALFELPYDQLDLQVSDFRPKYCFSKMDAKWLWQRILLSTLREFQPKRWAWLSATLGWTN